MLPFVMMAQFGGFLSAYPANPSLNCYGIFIRPTWPFASVLP